MVIYMAHKYKTNKDMEYLIGKDIALIMDIAQHTSIGYDRLILYINKYMRDNEVELNSVVGT